MTSRPQSEPYGRGANCCSTSEYQVMVQRRRAKLPSATYLSTHFQAVNLSAAPFLHIGRFSSSVSGNYGAEWGPSGHLVSSARRFRYADDVWRPPPFAGPPPRPSRISMERETRDSRRPQHHQLPDLDRVQKFMWSTEAVTTGRRACRRAASAAAKSTRCMTFPPSTFPSPLASIRQSQLRVLRDRLSDSLGRQTAHRVRRR